MHFRPYSTSDADAVLAMMARRRAVDGRSPLSEHKAIRVGDGASIEMVAERSSSVAAYAHAAHHPASEGAGHWAMEVVVAPDADAPALVVGALVQAVRRRISSDAVVTLWGWREPELEAARAQQWPVVRRLHQMTVGLPLAAGHRGDRTVAIRSFVRGRDEEAWIAANHQAFADHPENGAVDRENLEVRLDQSWFDPAGFLLAEEGDQLLGFCWTKLHPNRMGEIYIIGVVPAAQGRGLGATLLHAGLDDLSHRQGATRAMLYVAASDERALRLYERVGFEVTFTNREFAVPPAEYV